MDLPEQHAARAPLPSGSPATTFGPAELGSIYRGNALNGIGEGPVQPILHGEQYLDADPPLRQDRELLDAIRPWMTLDARTRDHQDLDDRLEAWSCFSHGGRGLLVRLCSAGLYDRRASYFAHARVWSLDAAHGCLDPGAQMGSPDHLERPWRSERPRLQLPSLVREPRHLEKALAEPEVAEQILVYLLQALANRQRLVIAAPLSELAIGRPLATLVSFARAALPLRLKQQCRARIFTRSPEQMITELDANLLVVPDDLADSIPAIEPGITLLGRDGGLLSGTRLDDDSHARAYGREVVDSFKRLRSGLLQHSQRYDRLLDAEPWSGASMRAVARLCYNLAFAFEQPETRLPDLVQRYLPQAAATAGPSTPWAALLSASEWSQMPASALIELILNPELAAAAGTTELQQAAEAAAIELGLVIPADRLESWWKRGSQPHLQRLGALLSRAPATLATEAAAAITSQVPTDQLPATDESASILRNELRHGVLSHRGEASMHLAGLATRPGVLAVLVSATNLNSISSQWAEHWIDSSVSTSQPEPAITLLRHTTDPSTAHCWPGVAEMLARRLLGLGDSPIELINAASGIVQRHASGLSLELHLLLAELASRASPEVQVRMTRTVLDRAGGMTSGAPELLAAATDPACRCLDTAAVARLINHGPPPWCLREPETVLGNASLVQLLDTEILLRISRPQPGRHSDRGAAAEVLVAELDRRLGEDPQGVSDALISTGWWLAWRLGTSLGAGQLELVARLWLKGPARGTINRHAPTLEAWELAVADLSPRCLGSNDIDAILGIRDEGQVLAAPPVQIGLWPWIPCFTDRQIISLGQHVADLDTLIYLWESVAHNAPTATYDELVSRSSVSSGLGPGAVRWLLSEQPAGQQLEPPALDQALLLRELTTSHREQAVGACAAAILAGLENDPEQTLCTKGIDRPELWCDASLLSSIRDWLVRQDGLQRLEHRLLERLDALLPAHPPGIRENGGNHHLAISYARSGLDHIAELLEPGTRSRHRRSRLLEDVLTALGNQSSMGPCWSDLAAAIQHHQRAGAAHPTEHPLDQLAALLREEPGARIRGSAQSAVKTLLRASALHKTLREPTRSDQPALPILRLCAAMLPDKTLGQIVAVLLESSGSEPGRRLEDPGWWCALINTINESSRMGGPLRSDDRPEVVEALLHRTARDLPPLQRCAFDAARKETRHA